MFRGGALEYRTGDDTATKWLRTEFLKKDFPHRRRPGGEQPHLQPTRRRSGRREKSIDRRTDVWYISNILE